jgi:cystathionine beta-lyase/cystathionine gamma-synthase
MMPPRSDRRPGLATLAIHGAGERLDPDDSAVPSLVRQTSAEQELGGGDALRRSGFGATPNADSVQKRLAALEGGEAALVTATGMGATACALLALLRPGDHLLASSWLPGGTRRLLVEEFGPLGIDVTLVDPLESRGWRKRLRKQTRAIFIESPSYGTGRVLDLRPISYLTHEIGLALVVDATWATPAAFRPLEHGADVVLHASLRPLGGHADILGGVVVGTASYIDEVREKMLRWGQAADPEACWLLQRGLTTLPLRLARQGETAGRLARWAAGRKEVRRVHWAGLEDHPDHEISLAMLARPLPSLAFELSGGNKAVDRFVRKLRLVRNAPSLGGVDTSVSEPRLTTHAHLDAQERGLLGMPDGFVHVSVGLEDAEDLIADFEQALR